MAYKPTGKTYKLATYADFMALTDEQFAMMLPDFAEWKRLNSAMQRTADMVAKALGMDEQAKKAAFKLPDAFEWIDDGKHDAEVGVQLVGKDGEVLKETKWKV